jgi:hypothetical protein
MLKFMDRVRVKEKGDTKIIAPGQQAALLFQGHEGYVIGQKKDLSYAIWFKDAVEQMGFPEAIVESFPETELEHMESYDHSLTDLRRG